MNSDLVWQFIRYVLLAVGGIFIHRGTITQATLDNIIGYGLDIFTFGWGMYVKYGTKAVPLTTAARKDVPTVNAATGAVIPGNS